MNKKITAVFLGLSVIGYSIFRVLKQLQKPQIIMSIEQPVKAKTETKSATPIVTNDRIVPTIGGKEIVTDVPMKPTMPQWRQKIVADKEAFLKDAKARASKQTDKTPISASKGVVSDEAPLTEADLMWAVTVEHVPVEDNVNNASEASDVETSKVGKTKEETDSMRDAETVTLEVVAGPLEGVILLGGYGINPEGAEYRKLIRKALARSKKDPKFVLKLSGQTYGLGARGTEADGHRDYNAADILKLDKKAQSLTKSKK